MKITQFILLLLVPGLLFVSCNSDQKVQHAEEDQNQSLPSHFTRFYTQFHADSIFQMEHILFPLSGIPSAADSIPDIQNFKWTKEDWRIHKELPILEQEYVQELHQVNESLIVEKIRHNEYKFAMERRFAHMDEEWMLIYYAAMNPFQ